MKLEWLIATRYLKSKRKESFVAFISWFSLIGIMLGVAVLIIVMSVMNGFRKEMVRNIIGAEGHVFVYANTQQFPEYNKTIAEIKKNPNVIMVAPVIKAQVLVTNGNYSSGTEIYGLTLNDLKTRHIFYDNLQSNIEKDALESFTNNEKIIFLGRAMARNLQVKVGNTLTIISPTGYVTALGSMPSLITVKVGGIIDTGMYQYDVSTLIMPFGLAQSFFHYENTAQRLDVFLKDPYNLKSIKQELYLAVKNGYLETWEDNNKYLINALEVERNVMFLILSLVILIAAFNIVSALTMLVRSKTKEIAILRTLGLSKKAVLTIFLLIGLRIGFVGTVLGSIIGVVFSLNIETIRQGLEYLLGINLFSEEIYFLSKLPADVHSVQIVLIIGLTLFFALSSAIYPAWKAYKIKPAEGIKYE